MNVAVQRLRSPIAFRHFGFRPEEEHSNESWSLQRWEPVSFLLLAGGFVLYEHRQPTIGFATICSTIPAPFTAD